MIPSGEFEAVLTQVANGVLSAAEAERKLVAMGEDREFVRECIHIALGGADVIQEDGGRREH